MNTIQQCSDASLISLYKNGNNAGLETIISRYKDKIYTTIYMLVKDQYLAEDIFQETFFKIIRTIKSDRYAEQGKFLPFAIRVARNLCMDHFRHTRQHVPVLLEDGTELTELLNVSQYSDSSRMEDRETCKTIRELIEALPEEQREVISLRIYGELSFKEIGDFTGVSINTALGRMRYGLINLRKMITEQQLVFR